MRAAYINETGPPENITIGDLPAPKPTANQVLVKVACASVNPIDTYLRSGSIPAELPMPYILGCDLAGRVEGVGSAVEGFKGGDRVWGSNQGLLGRQGTFAEFAAVDAALLYHTPTVVSDEAAAACALVGITAHLGLVREAKLQMGETLVVNGASGSVGSTVVQMAKILGAKVIATTGSDKKIERCQSLGADHVINYATEDVSARVRELAPQGVHVWWETSREPDFDRIVDLLAQRGRIVLMAGREARPPFPVGPFYVKSCRLHGFVMFMATPEEQQKAAEDINRWVADGKLRAQIDRVMPLDEAAAAHRLQEGNTLENTGGLSGKLVVRI